MMTGMVAGRHLRAVAVAVLAASVVCGGVAMAQSPPDVTTTPATQTSEPSFEYDEGPKFKRGKIPLYPPSFVRSGRKASALIEYTVSAEGEPESVRVLETSDPKFSGHIVAVIRRSKFHPAIKDGKPVRGTMEVRFSLE